MKKPAVTFALVAGALMLLCQSAFAKPQSGADQHVCTADDLVHTTWKMVMLREAPPARDAAWAERFPYHYLAFPDGANYTFVASDKPYKTLTEARAAMAWSTSNHINLLYRIGDGGVLDLYMDKKLRYHYRCMIVDKVDGDYRKGDMVLTAYTNHQKSYVYKWYRRWQ